MSSCESYHLQSYVNLRIQTILAVSEVEAATFIYLPTSNVSECNTSKLKKEPNEELNDCVFNA